MDLKKHLIALLCSESAIDRATALEINKGLHLIDDMLDVYNGLVTGKDGVRSR